MKTCLILMFLSFTQLATAVETCDYVDEENASGDAFKAELMDDSRPLDEYERWLIDLDTHLMKHDDINVAALALANFDSSFSHRLDHETAELILNPETKLKLLRRIADSLDTNIYSLKLAQSMCGQTDLTDKCPIEQITEKLFELEPENMAIYLQDLADAVADDDSDMIEMVLNRMSKSKYVHIMSSIPNSFQIAIEDYLFDHPIPIEKDLLLFEDEKKLEEFSDSEIEAIQFNVLISSIKMTSMMSQMPALMPLFEACEYDQKHAKSCLKIAGTLINNSDSIIMTMTGYNLLVKANELLGDEKAIERSQIANEEFNVYYRCLLKNHYRQDDLDIYTDPIIQKLFVEGSHEGKYMEQIAVHLYEKYKKTEVKGLTDPKTCGLRYIK